MEKAPGQKIKKEYTHDFFKDRVNLFLIVGYAELRTPLYISYVALSFAFHLYIQAMSVYAGYLVTPRTDLVIAALHGYLISSFAILGLTSRLSYDRRLQNTRSMLVKGLYLYEDEDIDENQEKILQGILSEVKKKSNIFLIIFIIGSISNMLLFPMSQIFMFDSTTVDPDLYEILNPYLPHFFYPPFSHWTWWGFGINYLLNALIYLYVYGTAAAMNEIYVSCTVQLKAHLQVLNYSIKNIEKRAYEKYLRINGNTQLTMDDLFNEKDFQNCLYKCLKENIKHHLALVKFKNEFMPYTGACITEDLVLATIIYATILYLIYQQLPLNYVINLIVTLLSEQTYSFYICVYGQEIIDESGKLYSTLYGIRWMDCTKSFNKAVDIMMCNTMRPFRLKALIISTPASLETYADIISAVYKMLNLVKHSDDTKKK